LTKRKTLIISFTNHMLTGVLETENCWHNWNSA